MFMPEGRLTISLIAILVGSLVLAAELMFEPMPSTHLASPDTSAPTTAPEASPAVDLRELTAWHLFGQVTRTPPAGTIPAIDPASLPDTGLDVTLAGVLADPDRDARRSWAIIAAPGLPERRYGVGDTLPGGAVIEDIMAKAVVLSYQGKREALRLRDPDATGEYRPVPAIRAPNVAAPRRLSNGDQLRRRMAPPAGKPDNS
jgi:type II secretory pathway component PulC